MIAIPSTLAFGFAPGPYEMMIIGVIALLLFGKRLPEVARSMGKGLVEFKKGMQGIEDEVNSAVHTNPHQSSAASRPTPPAETDEWSAPAFELPQEEPKPVESTDEAKA